MKTNINITPRNWDAHNQEGVKGWVVAPLHPSGDGSHYAPITQRLAKDDARLIAAAPDLLEALRDLLAWANLDHSTNPKTVALRDKCKSAIKNAISD